MPSILYGDRRQRRLALALTLGFLALTACGRGKAGETGPAAAPILRAGEPTRKVRVFLISPADNGRTGHKVGCGDSAVPVEISLPRPEPSLEGALRALLALKEPYHEPSGLSNPLYSSALELVRIERQGTDARIYLKGYLEMGGQCDNPRILAELQETALQFSDVARVQFFLEDRPLAEILSGKG
ncbi:MAG: hypothetical protein QOJ16_3667 [Acidobacteriota bacterium]|nr:hypothetical protein [Acidobacteriota bacterium]